MGVVSNSWFDRVFTPGSLHVRTIMLTGVATRFLGTPLAPLKLVFSAGSLPRVFYAHWNRSDSVTSLLADHGISKAPNGNGIGATGSKNWVWF